MTAFLGNDQGSFKLPGVGRVDAEVSGQFHGATGVLRDETERTVGEHRRVQGGVIVVRRRHHAAQVLPHQFGMVPHRFGEGTENHAGVRQFFLERGRHGNAVEYRIHGHPGQHFLLVQRDTQFLVGFQQFRVNLVQAFGAVRFGFWSGVIGNGLVVDGRVMHVRPFRFGHARPAPERIQAPFQQPFGFFLFGGYQCDNLFVEAGRDGIGIDLGNETVFVFLVYQFFNGWALV